jgi:hypothetical protein
LVAEPRDSTDVCHEPPHPRPDADGAIHMTAGASRRIVRPLLEQAEAIIYSLCVVMQSFSAS